MEDVLDWGVMQLARTQFIQVSSNRPGEVLLTLSILLDELRTPAGPDLGCLFILTSILPHHT